MNPYLVIKKGALALLLIALVFPLVTPPKSHAKDWIAETPTNLTYPSMDSVWDAFFEDEMERYGVHGATMVAVRGDEIVFSKGYGYADAARQMPFDLNETILRSGSIAKTLTATAVFQLAERGQLDLDADVNRYLSTFKIPDTFPQPVTARQLVNMTAGFDTRAIGIRAPNKAEIMPLEDYVVQRMPPRVLPPGRYRRYNDHELVLAGYLVQVISGMPYEEYVRENIFEPLEMHNSSIYLLDEQFSQAARGYPVGGGAGDAYPSSYYYLNTAPGAGFNTTVTDMARYVIAHLQLGSYRRGDGKRVRILGEATAREMQSVGFRYHPRLKGQANSFDEMFHNGHRYLQKSGGAPGMQNSMLLLPSQGMGFYLFANTDGYALRNNWTRKVVETYLSDEGTVRVKADRAAASGEVVMLENYTGNYLEVSDQTSHTTIVKVQALLNPDLWRDVEASPNGGLLIGNGRYTAVKPDLFENAESGSYTAFELNQDGRASFLFQGRFAYQRVSWVETPAAQFALLGFSLLVFLVGIGATAIHLMRRRIHQGLLAGLISALNLLFLAGLVVVLLPVATGGDIWQFSLPPSLGLRSVFAIPVITASLSIVLLGRNIIHWSTSRPRKLMRLIDFLVLIGMAAFLIFLHTWNLLGWRF